MSSYVAGIPSIDEIAKKLAATERQVAEAMRHAIRKTMTWAGNQGRSGISSRLRIRLSALKGRVRIFIRADDGIAKSFFGLNDLPSSRLRPRQTPTGATMEGLSGEIPHAFVASKRGKKFMWRRTGKERLPIEMIGLPINAVGQDVIASDVFPKVEGRFIFEFERELRWQATK